MSHCVTRTRPGSAAASVCQSVTADSPLLTLLKISPTIRTRNVLAPKPIVTQSPTDFPVTVRK